MQSCNGNMAEGHSLESTIDRNFLECGICFEHFKDPRGLPCLHSFCYGCLKDWAIECSDDMSIVSCPLCKRVYQIGEEGVEGFPVDFRVANLRDKVDSERPRKSQNQVCQKHGQEIQYFCNTCGCTTCSDCGLLDPTHTGHKFIRLKEATKQTSGSFQSLTKKVETVNQIYTDALQKTRRIKETLQRAVREKQVIDDAKEEFCQQLEILVTNYTQDVHKKNEETLKQITHIEEKLQIDQSMVRSIFHQASSIIESGSDSDIISEYPSIADSLEQQLCRCQPQAAVSKLSQLQLELPKHVDVPSLGKLIKKLNITTSTYHRIKTNNLSKRVPTSGLTSGNTASVRSKQRDSRAETTKGTFHSANSIFSPHYATMSLPNKAEKLRISSNFSSQPVKTSFLKSHGLQATCEMSLKKWKESVQIKTKPNAEYPISIAIHFNGDFAVTNEKNTVAIFSRSGRFKHTIQGSPTAAMDIAITPSNRYIIPGEEEFYIYDSQCQLLNTTPTYDTNNQRSKPKSVAVDSRGRIIVGLTQRTVLIHQPDRTLIFQAKGSTGSIRSPELTRVISKFQTRASPRNITCTPDDNLVISFYDKTLQVMNQSGHNARIIQPPSDIKSWVPSYVCCSNQGELFVSNLGNPIGVYRYVCTDGVYTYLDCVANMSWHSRGIALSSTEEELFVVNYGDSSIHIFRNF